MRLLPAILPALAFATLALPARSQDWAGAYAGGLISADTVTVHDTDYADPLDLTGTGYGLFVGYNFQSGPLVFGPELVAIKHSGDGDDGEYFRPASAKSTIGLRGRIGYSTGKALPYLALGYAQTGFRADHEGDGDQDDFASAKGKGVSVALGVDLALSENSFLRVEVEKVNHGGGEVPFYDGGDPHDYDMDSTRFSVGFAMRF